MEHKLLVLQGPNLNLLGMREPTIYGSTNLEQLHNQMRDVAVQFQIKLDFYQSNHEGKIIDKIHSAMGEYDGMIMNPGAFTHYSYAIADAISSVQIPLVEVHISNIYKREDFRHHSVIAPLAIGQISGLGMYGYIAAIHFFDHFLNTAKN